MKNDKRIGVVYETSYLEQFKHLDNNREIKLRAEKVKKSIEKHGWINQPILCNEKMEVVDGQARLQACKELGISISYIVIEGLGINECRVLNSINSNWNINDYIDSYAETSTDYKYIKELVEKIEREIGKNIGMTHILRQALNTASQGNLIKAGQAKLSADDYNAAVNNIEYIKQFKGILEQNGLLNSPMIGALYYASRKSPKSVKAELLKAFEKRCGNSKYIASNKMEDAFAIIDDIYNFNRVKQNRFYLTRVYEDEGLYDRP